MNSVQQQIIAQILAERSHQDNKWGPLPRRLDSLIWLAVLAEELGEVGKEISRSSLANEWADLLDQIVNCGEAARTLLEAEIEVEPPSRLLNEENYQEELTQLGAVAIAAPEDYRLEVGA